MLTWTNNQIKRTFCAFYYMYLVCVWIYPSVPIVHCTSVTGPTLASRFQHLILQLLHHEQTLMRTTSRVITKFLKIVHLNLPPGQNKIKFKTNKAVGIFQYLSRMRDQSHGGNFWPKNIIIFCR